MPKRLVNVPRGARLTELDIVSYGRRGRHTALEFSAAQIEQIARTVRGVPEVIIKVSGGGKSAEAVRAHLAYIDRHGKLDLLTDDGERLQGKSVAAFLVDDWNLEVGRGQYRPEAGGTTNDRRPKQVHNIVFSMPAGTSPEKLLAATQKFAREKFALQHRYAMVLHTEQGHPHVHLVVKAVSEQGERLYIRKATLQHWREDFAGYLRELGVAANATPSVLRGRVKTRKKDGIYRALKRGQSTFVRRKVEEVAEELRRGRLTPEPVKERLTATQAEVIDDWRLSVEILGRQGHQELARDAEAFVASMPAALTEKEALAKRLLSRIAAERARPKLGGDQAPPVPNRVR